MNNVDFVKRNYSIIEIARRLGLEVKRDNKALCPFHNDNTPSLSFNERENYYHCFGCGAGGDNIKFVMEVLHCDFYSAIDFITGSSNYYVYSNKRSINKEEKKSNYSTDKKQNYNVYNYFIELLKDDDAKTYLQKRLITDSQIIKRKIKNIPKDKNTQREIIKNLIKNFNEESLIKSGIIAKKNNSLYLFHYKHRLLLPYFDENKNIISIQGRNIDNDESPKYLFNKNSNDSIYNIDKISEMSKDIVLCEGVIDALSLERLGFDSIALSGVSKFNLIEKCDTLKNYNIYLFADEDLAGLTLIKKLYNKENFKGKFLLEKFIKSSEKIKDINELILSVEIKSFQIENIVYNYFEMPNDKICILDYYIFTKDELKNIEKNNFNETLKHLIKQKKES